MQVYAAGDAAKGGKQDMLFARHVTVLMGWGNKALNSPKKISGQEPWYLERQLKNFLKQESEVQIQKTNMECK
ncbi:MAG: hypothetical protein Ct9H300mP28_22210 [Pseudomonadota bacterium]|nr:MAG: hypothetical protein Ct9H300mP28_22210 [Pseudomonadota bacterium]